MKLKWALIVCTYNRADFLLECLRHALNQSRLPSEIVIVDASDYWQETRDKITERYSKRWEEVSLIYRPAEIRSIPFQRNQALDLTTAEIIFSLDDDIYLEPTAAEEIMTAYDSDTDKEIAIIGGRFTESAPSSQGLEPKPVQVKDVNPNIFLRSLKTRLENQLTLQKHFVPYSRPIRFDGPPPSNVKTAELHPSGLMNGGRTTFRRCYGIQSKWSTLLRYYATHEDSDFSYRTSFFGQVLVAPKAGFFHADGAEDRPDRFRTNSIRVQNLMALHRVESDNRIRSAFRLVFSFLRFTGLYLLIDPARGRYSLPIARAYLWGAVLVPYYMFFPFKNFKSWYTDKQEKLYGAR